MLLQVEIAPPPLYVKSNLTRMQLDLRNIHNALGRIKTKEPRAANTSRTLKLATKALLNKLTHVLGSPWLLAGPANSVNRARQKRGLFDLWGHVLKKLYGVAHMDDIKQLQHKINLFDANFQALNDFELGMARNMKINHDLLGSLHAKMSKLTLLINNMGGYEDQIIWMVDVLARLGLYENYMDQIRDIGTHMQGLIAKTKSGKKTGMDTHLLPFGVVRQINNQAIKELKLRPIIELNESSLLSYLGQTKVVAIKGVSDIVVLIPYVDHLHSYKVRNLLPFPTKRGNKRVILEQQDIYFFVPEKLDYILKFTPSQIERCFRIVDESKYYCPPMIVALSMARKLSCIEGLIAKSAVEADLDCPLIEFKSQEVRHILLEHSHFLSVPREITATLICDGISKLVKLKLMNEIKGNCEIHTPSFAIFAVKKTLIKRNLTVELAPKLRPIHYPKEANSHLNISILPEGDWQDPLKLWNQTQELIKDKHEGWNWGSPNHQYTQYAINGFIVLALILAGLALFKLWKLKLSPVKLTELVSSMIGDK